MYGVFETYQELLDVHYNRVCTFFALLQLYPFVLKGVLDCCHAMHCGVLCRNWGEIVLGAVLLITIVDY